jgi:hypothetical protein
MNDLASRELRSWLFARCLAECDSLWGEAAGVLSDQVTFWKDQPKPTIDEFMQEFGDILASLETLEDMPIDEHPKSGRFSGQERLLILCFGFEINPPAPEFPDKWCGWDDNDLDELAKLLSKSPLFVTEKKIDRSCVEVWLKELEVLFTFSCSCSSSPV